MSDPRLDLIDACARTGNQELVDFARLILDTHQRLTEAAGDAWDAIPDWVEADSLAQAIAKIEDRRIQDGGKAIAQARRHCLNVFAQIDSPEVQGAVAVLREAWR